MDKSSTILSICHNVKQPDRASPDDGHVWLELKTGDRVTTYGLWPELGAIDRRLQSLIEPNGWNQSGTHVQKDVEQYWKFAKKKFTALWKRSWRLDQAKTAQFQTLIGQPQAYSSADNNCADWATRIVATLAAVDLTAQKEFLPGQKQGSRMADPTQGTMISAPRLMESNVLRLDWRDNMLTVTKPVTELAAEPMLPVAPTVDNDKNSTLMTLAAPVLAGGLLVKKAGMVTLLN